jgi:TPP-dependent pyruvate/acetoin dehydrogenase alpha subunit
MPAEQLFGDYGALASIVAATGMESRYVDGRDVLTVVEVMTTLVERARFEGKPAFLECGVFRVKPHSLSDPDYLYRERGAGEAWLRSNDPIVLLRSKLETDHRAELDAIDAEVETLVRDAVAHAEAAPRTPAQAATANVYATPELGDA